jgi:Domain of unknown function (DUF4265)
MPNQVKVQFSLGPYEHKGIKTETVWAEEITPGKFRILNSPFFVFGISAADIVSAEKCDQVFEFKEVISRGGHSTYRLFLQGGRTINSPDFQLRWKALSELGATFENADDHFVSIDIPPERDIAEIYKLMENGEEEGIWVFEEAHYGGR